MTEAANDRMAELTWHETRLVLDSFDHHAAWRLGALMVERALREDAPIIIDIRRPSMVLFRSALTGTTAENEAWLERKARTVFRFETSTALLAARFAAQGVDPSRRNGSTRSGSRLPEAPSRCESAESEWLER
jgi:uncharacterized protein (UPF0303 family)